MLLACLSLLLYCPLGSLSLAPPQTPASNCTAQSFSPPGSIQSPLNACCPSPEKVELTLHPEQYQLTQQGNWELLQ